MSARYSITEKVEFAEWMRAHPTPSEGHVWSTLGTMRYMRWARQELLWGWVVDFYCPEWRIVLEIDGLYHEDAEVRESDAERDRVLREKGFTVFRVASSAVYDEDWFEQILEFMYGTPAGASKIRRAIEEADQCPVYAR